MAKPFIGEIRMFAGNFAPRGWALCNGQILSSQQNESLFALLGTIYGGDGRTTFGLPDMRGRIPIHAGFGPALSPRPLGTRTGVETVSLTVDQIPSHTHGFLTFSQIATTDAPANAVVAASNAVELFTPDFPRNEFASAMVTNVGRSQSHTNLQPFLCINFIVALVGIFPSRN